MKSKVLFLVFALVLSFFKGISIGGYLDQEYQDMDADEDGYINWDELKFYEKGATPEEFSEIDKNSNGRIEFWEWVAYRDKDYPYESIYEKRARDFYCYKRYPRHRYWYYDSYPWYGFSFHYGYGPKERLHHGFGFYLDNRHYRRYGPHHYRDRHYYGYRYFGHRYHYR